MHGQVLFEVQALSNFVAQEADDLSFKEREILRILESRLKMTLNLSVLFNLCIRPFWYF